MSKRKTVEIILRVRVPADWSAAHTRREIAAVWYGAIYAAVPRSSNPFGLPKEVTIRPRWGRASEAPTPGNSAEEA